MSDFLQRKITTAASQACTECHHELKTGETVLMKFERDPETRRTDTTVLCDEICLSDYRERRGASVNRLLNKLSTQFN